MLLVDMEIVVMGNRSCSSSRRSRRTVKRRNSGCEAASDGAAGYDGGERDERGASEDEA